MVIVRRAGGCDPADGDPLLALYERSYRRLVTHFIALCGSRPEAEDVVQDAFLLASLLRGEVAEAQDKEYWVRIAAWNLLRRRRRRSRVAGTVVPRLRSEVTIDLGPQAPETHVAIVYAASRLSLPVRAVLVLHEIDGLDVTQIAHELSIPEGMVRGRLARARAEMAAAASLTAEATPSLAGFARDTERRLDPPPFEVMLSMRRRARRHRTVLAAGAALSAMLAFVLAAAGMHESQPPSVAAEQMSQEVLPGWTAEQVIASPDAFVVRQVESRTDLGTGLTVWKRCVKPRADHDCFGREAITVADGHGHRLATLGAVTGSSQQPSLGDDGLLREVGEGLWYWAHREPGPYLLSAAMRSPTPLTFSDRPAARSFGVPSIECPDRVGLCALDPDAGAIERLARPDVPDARWATPTATGCGLWALAGSSGNLRLVIQQRDGSFAAADIPDDAPATAMAEGGTHCEIAYYQVDSLDRCQLVVSLDEGKTWQVRKAVSPAAGPVEQQPRPRVLLPTWWPELPAAPHALRPPGPLQRL